LRALVGWIFANLAAETLKAHVTDDNYLRIRYEDLVGKPSKILSTIGTFLSLDLSCLADRLLQTGLDVSEKHQIMGNPMRFEKTIRIKPDLAWVEGLDPMSRLMCWLSTSYILKKYGYTLRRV
jgi:hypothetical protein